MKGLRLGGWCCWKIKTKCKVTSDIVVISARFEKNKESDFLGLFGCVGVPAWIWTWRASVYRPTALKINGGEVGRQRAARSPGSPQWRSGCRVGTRPLIAGFVVGDLQSAALCCVRAHQHARHVTPPSLSFPLFLPLSLYPLPSTPICSPPSSSSCCVCLPLATSPLAQWCVSKR